MAVRQDRAVRTRRAIVRAAASVFDEYGFEAASVAEILNRASVTKGALYFHFSSKEELARGVLSEQTMNVTVPARDYKAQELVDLTLLVAHGLLHDPVLRAGTRLSLDQGPVDFSDASPFGAWSDLCARLLAEGKERGEVLPHVDPKETGDFVVGCFTGIQAVSRVESGRVDLGRRILAMWKHVLPGIVSPSLLTWIDVGEDRIARVAAEAEAAARGAASEDGGGDAATGGADAAGPRKR
ncbi:TetR/AcrR family transcriptional regulator [Streptomyces durbertensis]|uniref:TetR/AcrR family transcriptional regulator n=1 Tax=Streptomyces durbertensis TaxID=2448886 RepID=A0ABR6E9J3_9ACTN|nr:ScbR family autoregulator-binding transcription factor [Streptomyces durbertensis]MBB1242014.1 TetR/AcrR family transcriptional regulator [Streptomyces durbertensis]